MPSYYRIFRAITSGVLIAMSAYLLHFALAMEEMSSRREVIKEAKAQAGKAERTQYGNEKDGPCGR